MGKLAVKIKNQERLTTVMFCKYDKAYYRNLQTKYCYRCGRKTKKISMEFC